MSPREKDRRSAMNTSSVHAHPKKDGAGGKFTWGAATENGEGVEMDRKDPNYIVGQPPNELPLHKDPIEPEICQKASVPENNEDEFPSLGAQMKPPSPHGAWSKA